MFASQRRARLLLPEREAERPRKDRLSAVHPGLHSDGDPRPPGGGGGFPQRHGRQAAGPW